MVMKALILNSGLGKRMGELTNEHPKCMTELSIGKTIVSRQLSQLADVGITDIVMTTGPFADVLGSYIESLRLPINITYVANPVYDKTNYIYSIYMARELLHDDILLMHGDLVFENAVLDGMLEQKGSAMTVSSSIPLPEKDFKAVVADGRITKVGVEFFDDAVAAQPLYKLTKKDWEVWLAAIVRYCEEDNTNCYAEKALNEVSAGTDIRPYDVGEMLCGEVDNPEDLKNVSGRLEQIKNTTVYICFSTDILHSGHLKLIKRAVRLGRVIAGVMSDEAVASYKRYPLVPFEERCAMFKSVKGVWKVVEQDSLSYKDVIEQYHPDIVVHGDNWKEGFQKSIREEVIELLGTYGGRLVEFPYSSDPRLKEVDNRARLELSLPDNRRGRLRKLIAMKGLVTMMEAHDGISGLIVENTVVHDGGASYQFDGMWISSLCDSTAKGKPDIELVDMTSRFRTIDDITEVTTKPIIFDGDTGGLTEHFVYTVRSLEKLGVSAVIIEDKKGLKKNSLFGTEVEQTQATIEEMSAKIAAGKKAQKSSDFMIIARIESLILERGMEDALERAFAFVKAGADGIMIHSRRPDPDEIIEFINKFRSQDKVTPIVIVPTSFNSVKEDEWKKLGVNVVIYANQLMRAEVPAMQQTAEEILKNHRAKEADEHLMGFKQIIRLIPEEL